MNDEKQDFISQMPQNTKPVNLTPNPEGQEKLKEKLERMTGVKASWKKITAWIVVVLILVVIVVQYFNAAKYQALVQVIKEDKIGVNPTGESLDFGDLPHEKGATRSVVLQSQGNTGSYIVVWKFGDISDLLKVSKNYFTLKPHTTEKLEFSVYIPNSAEYRYYKGRVVLFQIPKVW